MVNPILPRVQSSIADGRGATTKEWYDFFRELLSFVRQAQGDSAELAEIEARLTALEESQTPPFTIVGPNSVRVFGTPADGMISIILDNDVALPPPGYYYGTNGNGERGWNLQTGSGIATFATYQWAPGSAAPTWGQFSANAETSPALATEFIFNRVDRTGQDHGGILKLLTENSILYGQSQVDDDAWGRFLVTGTSTPVGSDAASIPVTLLDAGPNPLTGWEDVNILLLTAVDPSTIDHNELGNLQGGAPGEYYHATADENTTLTALDGIGLGFAVRTSATTWTNRTFTNGTGYTWNNGDGSGGNPELELSANLLGWNGLATSSKENSITAGTAAQFWCGDKVFRNYLSGDLGSGGSFTGDSSLLGAGSALWAQGDNTPRFVAFRAGDSGAGAQFIGARSGGTMASKTATPNGGSLFELYGSSWRGDTWRYPAALFFIADEAHSVAGTGTRAEIRTTPTGSNSLQLVQRWTSDRHWHPGADNVSDIGNGSLRMHTLYAGTGTINTSDEREKTSLRGMTQQEIDCAIELSRLPCVYRFLSSVAEKGDEARLHVSPGVQSVISVMESHGLEPFDYGFVCYDEWEELPEIWNERPEERGEDGDVTREAGRELAQEYRPAGDRYSLRPSELAWFVIRGQSARQDALEARLSALGG